MGAQECRPKAIKHVCGKKWMGFFKLILGVMGEYSKYRSDSERNRPHDPHRNLRSNHNPNPKPRPSPELITQIPPFPNRSNGGVCVGVMVRVVVWFGFRAKFRVNLMMLVRGGLVHSGGEFGITPEYPPSGAWEIAGVQNLL